MVLLIIGEATKKYAEEIKRIDTDMDVRLWPETGPREDIQYALAWQPPAGELARLPNLKLIISVGAGIDHIIRDPDLPPVPLVRFVDPDLTRRMSDYVLLHTLYHTRRMCEVMAAQRQADWRYLPEPDAADLRVGIMGLGELGLAAARQLLRIGYRLNGWSRSVKTVTSIMTFAGDDELPAFLGQTDILVSLLPLTDATKGIINLKLLRQLAQDGPLPGPVLINAGRGGLQVEADILQALDSGALYAASLDVFETEPLPQTSPLWRHPHVVVTPHNAAESSAKATANYTLRQIRAYERGEQLDNLVNMQRGY